MSFMARLEYNVPGEILKHEDAGKFTITENFPGMHYEEGERNEM